jgi:uncharacterized protein YgiB involved in biofilm formation
VAKADGRQNPKSETNPNFVNFRMGQTGEPDKPRENRRTSREKRKKRRAAEPQPRQESGKKMGAKKSVNPESWGTGGLAAKKRKTRKGKNTRRP